MAHVEFKDFSFQVKAALNDTTIAWLYETSEEIKSQAQRKCALDGDAGKQLKGSYDRIVDEGKGEAQIGSPLEQAFWEEYGTGEHAKGPKPGRQGWWIYIKGQASGNGGQTYRTKEEAESMAAYIREKYGKNAVVTNGRDPNYTLQKAFEATKNKAEARLKAQLKEDLG